MQLELKPNPIFQRMSRTMPDNNSFNLHHTLTITILACSSLETNPTRHALVPDLTLRKCSNRLPSLILLVPMSVQFLQ